MKSYFLGVDVGTSQSKGVITDENGIIVAMATRDHQTKELKKGYFEHDADKIWYDEFCSLSKELIDISKLDPQQIKCVACSAIGPCVLPVDTQNSPLRPGILYGIDSRSTEEIELLNDKFSEQYIFEKSGNVLTTQSAGPKILWIKRNEPDIYEKTDCFLTSTSYIVCRLTGERVIDHYTAGAGYTPLYDRENLCWNEEFCEYILDGKSLPRLLWTDEIAGYVTEKAAKESGLVAGTPVTTGTADAASEAVCGGVVSPNHAMLMFGSTLFLIAVTEKSVTNPTMWSAPYLFKGSYAITGGMSAAGSITSWFKDQFCHDLIEQSKTSERNIYDLMSEEAQAAEKGSGGIICLPYFNGERTPINDPDAKAMFLGLGLRHTRAQIYRSIFEGVGFGIRHILENCDIGQNTIVSCVGGGVKSIEWMNIISDITNKKLHINKVTVGASYGNAFLAALASGTVKDSSEINSWISLNKCIDPSENNEIYDKYYDIYKNLYPAVKDFIHQL